MRKVLYIFGLLTDADIEWMAGEGIKRRLGDGDIVIREGEQTEWLILILEGEFLVSTRRLGLIAKIGAGEVVGEMSLVDALAASATVTAKGRSSALFLSKAALKEKIERDDGFGSRFYQALAVFLADRLRDARGSSDGYSLDDSILSEDELDGGVLDRVSSAGERYTRLLRILDKAIVQG